MVHTHQIVSACHYLQPSSLSLCIGRVSPVGCKTSLRCCYWVSSHAISSDYSLLLFSIGRQADKTIGWVRYCYLRNRTGTFIAIFYTKSSCINFHDNKWHWSVCVCLCVVSWVLRLAAISSSSSKGPFKSMQFTCRLIFPFIVSEPSNIDVVIFG